MMLHVVGPYRFSGPVSIALKVECDDMNRSGTGWTPGVTHLIMFYYDGNADWTLNW